jgi:hypothetical protein
MPLITALTSSLVMGWESRARAGIFDPLKTSVQCVATAASTGGGGSTLLTQMPGLLVAGVGISLFIGCVIVAIRYFVDSSRGEDTTASVRLLVSGVLAVVATLILENFILGDATC